MSYQTILLVDDEAQYHSIYRRLFRTQNIQMLSAMNGKEALSLLADPATPPIDLIILDHNMPGMSGIEFLEARALVPAYLAIPVMMSTSIPSDYPIFDPIHPKNWVLRFLPKPFKFEDLREL